MSYIIGFGEIMLRLSSIDNERLFQSSKLNATFGGVEANICVLASIFGLKSRYVTALPNNAIGKKVEELLLSHRVDTSAISWEGKRLGIYFVDPGNNYRSSNVIYDREYSSISQALIEDFDWDKVFNDASYFHISGVTPAISQTAADLTLYAVKEAKKRNVKVSCDINHRKKLWKYGKKIEDVMPEIVKYSDIVFANEYDAIKILGVKSDVDVDSDISDEDYKSIMNELIDKYSLDMVITTKREAISSNHNNIYSMLYAGKKLYKSKKYYIKNIIDRIGTGDSFAAGILSGIQLFDNYQDILEFAAASFCIKHSIPGDWNLTTKDEVINLMKSKDGLDVKR
ncbi:sugar kinase [Brachyspira hampsonii]|uniref:Carbohydrate kinase n=1 Tax=Brachyspira hampsonii TaxID=1287055 RepID=A0AAC9XKN7_9SPIR|nr:sugar kinase [Brachyspira hampsonii]ASJ21014.1 carbohydrate kinase [Brachyspira hampsonii]ELV06627.1 PfkB family carbohydrate kinase [Brachyspira hampsonii 30599]MBW5380213.1 sugar kinase [Brachyspira hampsonii]MBW5408772.1 sugar kinase [Brachyspira hampsonii]OEJ13257.1 carbohydrate kinase [Brachyspira hampsonii]